MIINQHTNDKLKIHDSHKANDEATNKAHTDAVGELDSSSEVKHKEHNERLDKAIQALRDHPAFKDNPEMAGQLNAILDGLPAAAEYESLVDNKLKDNGVELALYGKGEGQNKMIPQSMVHLLIVLFIIFGNISYFLKKRDK